MALDRNQVHQVAVALALIVLHGLRCAALARSRSPGEARTASCLPFFLRCRTFSGAAAAAMGGGTVGSASSSTAPCKSTQFSDTRRAPWYRRRSTTCATIITLASLRRKERPHSA